MDTALQRYRVMAYIVGVFTILVVGGFVLKLVTDEDSSIHKIGNVTAAISPVHGVLYMILLVCAALLSRQAGWSIGFTLTTMVLATIPFVSFWAERRATRHTRAVMAQESPAG